MEKIITPVSASRGALECTVKLVSIAQTHVLHSI